jgi:hypothetical protein
MRKVLAGALAAVALSWAQGVPAADAAKERREAADATKAQAKEKTKEAQGSMQRGAGSMKDSMHGTASGAQGAQAEKKHPVFEGKKNFDVDGKVAEVSPTTITIQRNELPSAKLHVSKDTKVEVDGKKSSVQELKRGQDVKASFNLQGDKVEAVEIKADKLKKDDRKEMSEQRRDTQKEMNERARDAQQHNQQKSK